MAPQDTSDTPPAGGGRGPSPLDRAILAGYRGTHMPPDQYFRSQAILASAKTTASSPKPAKPAPDLPVEIWMQIFEQEILADGVARPRYVKRFQELKGRPWTVRIRAVPAFERRVVCSALQYFGINRASRTAAEKLDLAAMMLTKAEHPLQYTHDYLTAARLEEMSPAPSHLVLELYDVKDLPVPYPGQRQTYAFTRFPPEMHKALRDKVVASGTFKDTSRVILLYDNPRVAEEMIRNHARVVQMTFQILLSLDVEVTVCQ